MSIEIQPQPNLSLEDMQVAMKSGTSVLRSAHVGNARGYNLAVASAGIPMLLVDHNVVAQFPGDTGDNNYLPGSIVTAEDILPLDIGRVGGLVLRTTMKDPVSGQEVFLDEFHSLSLRSAFPSTEIVTSTTYIRHFADLVGEIVDVAAKASPELFRAVVENDGTLRREPKAQPGQRQRNFAGLLSSYGTLQLAADPRTERGVLIPNEVDIVVNFIIEAIKSGSDHQIHLSGPDMQLYLKDQRAIEVLQRLYQNILETVSFRGTLPDTIKVDLVPADQARFVGQLKGSGVLNAIFAVIAKETDQNQLKGAFMRSPASRNNEMRASTLKQFKANSLIINTELLVLAQEAGSFFAGPRDTPYFSQYDVLADGGLNIPTGNKQMTMQELKNLFKRLQKMHGQLQ